MHKKIKDRVKFLKRNYLSRQFQISNPRYNNHIEITILRLMIKIVIDNENRKSKNLEQKQIIFIKTNGSLRYNLF